MENKLCPNCTLNGGQVLRLSCTRHSQEQMKLLDAANFNLSRESELLAQIEQLKKERAAYRSIAIAETDGSVDVDAEAARILEGGK